MPQSEYAYRRDGGTGRTTESTTAKVYRSRLEAAADQARLLAAERQGDGEYDQELMRQRLGVSPEAYAAKARELSQRDQAGTREGMRALAASRQTGPKPFQTSAAQEELHAQIGSRVGESVSRRTAQAYSASGRPVANRDDPRYLPSPDGRTSQLIDRTHNDGDRKTVLGANTDDPWQSSEEMVQGSIAATNKTRAAQRNGERGLPARFDAPSTPNTGPWGGNAGGSGWGNPADAPTSRVVLMSRDATPAQRFRAKASRSLGNGW